MNLTTGNFPNVTRLSPEFAEALVADLNMLVSDIGPLLAALQNPPPPPPKGKSEAVLHAEKLVRYGTELTAALRGYHYKALCAQQAAELLGVAYDSIAPKAWYSVFTNAGLVRAGYTIGTVYANNSIIYCRVSDVAELASADNVKRRSYLPPGVCTVGVEPSPKQAPLAGTITEADLQQLAGRVARGQPEMVARVKELIVQCGGSGFVASIPLANYPQFHALLTAELDKAAAV